MKKERSGVVVSNHQSTLDMLGEKKICSCLCSDVLLLHESQNTSNVKIPNALSEKTFVISLNNASLSCIAGMFGSYIS